MSMNLEEIQSFHAYLRNSLSWIPESVYEEGPWHNIGPEGQGLNSLGGDGGCSVS